MIKQNLMHVLTMIEQAKIRYGRNDAIKLVAVSKYSVVSEIHEACLAGQTCFGENKVQDLSIKASALESHNLEWHFIGTLQENKINVLLKIKPALIHSLHSLKLAYALQKRLERDNMQVNALLQVNSAREDSKSGFLLEEAFDKFLEIKEKCPNILLSGLMCMGANTDDRRKIEKGFQDTQNLFSRLQEYNAHILSMGMSGDYEIAIACGSNCLRIGSQIFKA